MLLELKVENVEDVIESRLQEITSYFSRIAQRWQSDQATSESQWRKDVMHYIHDQPGYRAIEWLDNKYNVRWITPEEGNEQIKGYNLYSDVERRKELLKSSTKNELQMSSQFELDGQEKVLLLLSPLYNDNHFQGFMVGILDTETFWKIF